MTYIAYTLSMPNAGSWNGKWTGEDRCNCIVKKYKEDDPRLLNAQKSNYHYYDFGDGWGAGVKIKVVHSDEAKKLKKRSDGFCGYSWMVDEIEEYGRILTLKEHRDANK